MLLCGDNDDVGQKAMRLVREALRKAGVRATDTMTYAPHKGSIADLRARDLAALVERLITDRNPRWQKPARNHRKYAEYRCPHPRTLASGGVRLRCRLQPAALRETRNLPALRGVGTFLARRTG